MEILNMENARTCVAILWSHEIARDYHDALHFLNGGGETGRWKAFFGRETLKDLVEEDKESNF